ncbi:MAG TPA: TrkA family potassium uptake protein, partial [Firmicutes bacterium]|nr:TrkA family potassium uptake protein [Bacillota bacterium]
MNIIIVGGGNLGYHLAKRLGERNYVVLIEKNPEIGKSLANNTDVLVIHGDGCDPEVLKQAGIKKADVVAAVTGNDEDNLIICQLAKDVFKVKRTIAKVNNPKNEKIFNQLGVDVAIDSTNIIAKIIEDEIRWEDFINLLTFKKGKLSILRIDLPENSPVLNKKIKDIKLPPDSVLVAVMRNGEIIIPKGDLVLKEKDEVIAITKIENETLLFKSLMGKIEE